MKKIILTTYLITTFAIPLAAQTSAMRATVKSLRSERNITKQFAHLATKDFPNIHLTPGGAFFNAMLTREVANRQTNLNMAQQALPQLPATQPAEAPHRSWLAQQQRNYQARQLKRQHAQQLALPRLQPQEAFFTESFENFIADTSTVPNLPFLEQPDYLYRGLGLQADGEALAHIMEHGLLVQDAGSYSNNFILALTTNPEDAALAASLKYTNLTKSPQVALQYALKNKKRSAENVLPVIAMITGEVEYANRVRIQHDIVPDNIPHIIALLNVNGRSTWCHIEKVENGFLVVPYEIK